MLIVAVIAGANSPAKHTLRRFHSISSFAFYHIFITQRRSIAKNVGCFRQNLFVCHHDNFRTSKHRMIKLVRRCIAQKSLPSSNLGVIAPAGMRNPKMWYFADSRHMTQNVNKATRSGETSHRTQRACSICLQLRRSKNQRRLSSSTRLSAC